jgi:hypothetical protein
MTRMTEIWNAGEFERFLDELGPDLEFSPDPSFPDAGTYRGDEFRRWMRDWVATWQENRFEMVEISELQRRPPVRWRGGRAPQSNGGLLRPRSGGRHGPGRYWLTRQSMGVCSKSKTWLLEETD